MRKLLGMFCIGLAVTLGSAATAAAGDVLVKGPHICCPACVNSVNKILGKIEGVSEVKADTKSKTVSFKAVDSSAAKAGFRALIDGGFYGKATEDGKEIAIRIEGVKKGDAVASVTVKDVHVCCGACQSAIKGLFKGSKVSFDGSGAQRTVMIEGGTLEASAVLETLRKGGFNGSIQK